MRSEKSVKKVISLFDEVLCILDTMVDTDTVCELRELYQYSTALLQWVLDEENSEETAGEM